MSRTTRVHVKSCILDRISYDFVLSFLPPLCFFRNALLTCVHLNFSSCRTSRVDVEPRLLGIPPALLPFESRRKDRKSTFSSVQKFDYDVGQLCFRVSAVLAGNIEFSGAFRPPSSFACCAAGGIYANEDFAHLGGSLSVSNSSAKYEGAVPTEMSNSLRSFEGRVFARPCRRGGLCVNNNAVFATATASFSQCDWAFCLAR